MHSLVLNVCVTGRYNCLLHASWHIVIGETKLYVLTFDII